MAPPRYVRKACGRYVATNKTCVLVSCTPMIEWYMARLVVHKTDTLNSKGAQNHVKHLACEVVVFWSWGRG